MHGGADVPMPGRAFALEGRPPGTIVVGVLDLEQMRAIPGVEVRLVVTAPGVEPKTHTLAADDEGRATFSDLGELPEGATLVAEATLPASEGESEGETKRSEPFELKDKALAVILARGVLPQGHAETPPTPQGPQVRQLPGPRRDESLGEREVVVEVFDSADARVSGIEVELVRQDMTGAVAIVRANTNARGIATFENVADPEGGLFFAGVVYKGAPFDSPTFQLPAEVGARVALRVWPTTKDARRVRSAVQLDFEPRENDLVQITQEYMVLVEGDAAFWAPNFEITGAADAVGLQVLGHSGEYLEKAEEDSPVAQLARPIPPGEEVRLSVAYLVSHRGVAEVTAELPFPIVQGAITVPKGMPVLEGKQGAAQPQEDGQGPIDVYQFTPTSSYTPALCDVLAAGGGPCPRIFGQGIHEVRVVVGDLPHTNPWFVRAGWIVVATLLLALGTVLVLIPRVGIRRSLLEQRDALREAITRHRRTPDADEAELSRLLEALDGVLRRLDALDAGTEVS
jgi:hypothetical protein